ncbi:hypothetical protein SAMN02910353_01066 [Ruminococcus sp. YRD2003]|uniref:dockerin type I domain-containing protein n=1 Tax=Ruminococcus sp. YRD2003 TaxID=1452313 RepID=UPI0008D18A33|nr:hypothetical protein SAMN02910353_01066 [Ruminococcus flavefaciens]
MHKSKKLLRRMVSGYTAFSLAALTMFGQLAPASAAAENHVYSTAQTAAAGEEAHIPIFIENNTGFVSFNIYLSYDPDVLTPMSVSTEGSVLTGKGDVNDSIGGHLKNLPENTVQVTFTSSDYTNADADGLMFDLVCGISEEAQGSTAVRLSYDPNPDITFNADDEAVAMNCTDVELTITNEALDSLPCAVLSAEPSEAGGSLTLAAAYARKPESFGDMSFELTYDKWTFSAPEVSAFEGTVSDVIDEDGRLAFTITGAEGKASQPFAVTFKVDEAAAEGSYTFKGKGSAGETAFSLTGCKAEISSEIKGASPIISGPEGLSARKGEELTVPVAVGRNTGLMGFITEFSFDDTVLEIVSAESTKLLPGSMNNNVGVEKGKFIIRWSNTENTDAEGDFITLRFNVIGEAEADTVIGISYSPEDTFDEAYNDVALICKDITVALNKSETTTTASSTTASETAASTTATSSTTASETAASTTATSSTTASETAASTTATSSTTASETAASTTATSSTTASETAASTTATSSTTVSESETTTTATTASTTAIASESTAATTSAVTASVKISKLGTDGTQLAGAKLSLTGVKNDGSAVEFSSESIQVADGQLINGVGSSLVWICGAEATIVLAEDGTYTLHEEAAPAGYLLADDIVFVVSGGKVTVSGADAESVDMVDEKETSTTSAATTLTTTAATESVTTAVSETTTASSSESTTSASSTVSETTAAVSTSAETTTESETATSSETTASAETAASTETTSSAASSTTTVSASENTTASESTTTSSETVTTAASESAVTTETETTSSAASTTVSAAETSSSTTSVETTATETQTTAETSGGTTAATTATAPAVPDDDIGDVNEDGRVDAKDASVVLMAYAKLSTGADDGLTDKQRRVADVNGEGKVDAKDASAILAFYSFLQTGGSGSMKEYMANSQ